MRMHSGAGAALALATLLAARAAHADERVAENYYGWQNFLVDGASVSLLIGAASLTSGNGTGQGVLAALGAGGLLLGSPLIHGLGHGHWDKAAGSLGLRVLLPLGLAFVGGAVGALGWPSKDGCAEGCAALGFAGIGFGVGALTGVLIDDIGLAREPIPGLKIAPSIALGRNGRALAGLTLRF